MRKDVFLRHKVQLLLITHSFKVNGIQFIPITGFEQEVSTQS